MRVFATAVAAILVGASRAAPGISPASVSEAADPGASFKVDKVVSTSPILPKPDIVLLVDTTGSMTGPIVDIKKNLISVIKTVKAEQPDAEFAVVSFGDFAEPTRFKVVQALTDNEPALQAAVNSLSAGGGGDDPEDWINALYELSTGAVSYRLGSSRIIVLVSDQPSHDPSGGHTLVQTIAQLNGQIIRVIGIDAGQLDSDKQATKVTEATGGVIIPAGSGADAVTKAVVNGLKNLDVTVQPDVVSCAAGVTVEFDPAATRVSSGTTVTFHETARVADNAAQGKSLGCTVRFLLNGTPGGDTFVQKINATVNRLGCITCNPAPGKNLCHPTTSCAPTPYGTMCLTRPGFKADGAKDGDRKVQWRLDWPVPGHEHRVAVKPGTASNTECDKKNKGPDVCKEIEVGQCVKVALHKDMGFESDQIVVGNGEL